MSEQLDRRSQELAFLQVKRKAMVYNLVKELGNESNVVLVRSIREDRDVVKIRENAVRAVREAGYLDVRVLAQRRREELRYALEKGRSAACAHWHYAKEKLADRSDERS